VIVVANEADIPEAQREQYKLRKEKLIGKTVRVASDPGEVLDALVRQLRLGEAKSAIAVNREKLLATFAASTRPNFRSLRSALFDFERLARIADPQLRSSSAAMGKLLLYTVALGLEYHGNSIDADKLRTMGTAIPHRNIFAAKDSDLNERRIAGIDLRKRYEHVSWDDPVVPPAYMADLFASGSVDLDALNEFLRRHPAVVGTAATPSWRLMWSWYDLTDSQYRAARAEFLQDLSDRKLVQAGHILHAAGVCHRLVRYGDRIFGTTSVRAYFRKYLEDVEAKDELVPAPGFFTMSSSGYGGLTYNDNEEPGFAPIKTMVREAADRALERWLLSQAPMLMARLQADPSDGSMLHGHGLAEGNYAGHPILQETQIEDFADLCLDDGNLNGHLLSALRERYRQGYTKDLKPEFDWVINLRAELLRRVEKSSPPFKKFNRSNVEYYFADIVEVIEAERAKAAPRPTPPRAKEPARRS